MERQQTHVDHWVHCIPCGVDQRCPDNVSQTRFIVAHIEHGATGSSSSYRWPPSIHSDAELRHTMAQKGPPETELDYYQ